MTPDFDTAELDLQSSLSRRDSTCPPLSVLQALKSDCLPEELAEPARGHLLRCPLCQLMLEDIDTLSEPSLSPAQQERIAARLPGNAARSSFWSVQRSLLGLAAALLLMAGLFFWSHRERNVQVALMKSPSAPTPVLTREIPFTPLAAPSSPAELLTRGGGSGAEPSNEELLPAFRVYNRADYSVAIRNFQALSTQYPRSGLILLYLGVSQLALHQDQEAQTTLQHARETREPYDADAASWYSAIAASRMHSVEAQPLLENLCQRKTSRFSERSCQALQPAGSSK